MTSLEYYIEQIEQFISALTDDIESGEGTVVTQTKLAVYREVLEHLEEIEQEPCEDAISRQAVLEQIGQWAIGNREYLPTNAMHYLTRRIQDMPPVTPQPKTGHWIYKQYDGYPECGNWHCSECDKIDNNIPLYCPNCGAKMQEVEE